MKKLATVLCLVLMLTSVAHADGGPYSSGGPFSGNAKSSSSSSGLSTPIGANSGGTGTALGPLAPFSASSVNLINDTDSGDDMDDTYALNLQYALQDNSEVNTLAIIGDSGITNNASSAQAVSYFYGYSDIPFGGCVVGSGCISSSSHVEGDAIASTWANKLFNSINNVPQDAVITYRTSLASMPNSSVTIVLQGFLRSFYNLYNSPADSISPLTGAQLIAAKVKLIVCACGDYGVTYPASEFDLTQDPTAAQVINNLTTTPVIWSGFSLGNSVTTNATGILTSPALTGATANSQLTRPSWGPLATLYAIRGLSSGGETYFTLSAAGTNTVNGAGQNTFTTGGGGVQHYLIAGESTTTLGNTISTLVKRPPANVQGAYTLNNTGTANVNNALLVTGTSTVTGNSVVTGTQTVTGVENINGSGTTSQALNVVATNTTGQVANITQNATGTFVNMLSVTAPNVTTGQNPYITFGVGNASKNEATLIFNYAGSGSNSNRFDIGFNSTSPLFSILAGGQVGIGNTGPATTLDVNGDITMETGTAGAVLCLTASHAMGHCTAAASCTSTCTCTCAAN